MSLLNCHFTEVRVLPERSGEIPAGEVLSVFATKNATGRNDPNGRENVCYVAKTL
ncbi:MAG: hypothetical protein ACLUSP_08725 [Christensenellales bacterium]